MNWIFVGGKKCFTLKTLFTPQKENQNGEIVTKTCISAGYSVVAMERGEKGSMSLTSPLDLTLYDYK